MTTSPKPPRIDVLEVQDLRIVDRDGSTLARLARNDYGAFGLAIGESANGCPMIALKITASGEPCVEIRDREGHCRALLEVNHATGNVQMGLLDGKEKARACATVSPEGNSTLGLYDPYDKSKAMVINLKSSNPLPVMSMFNSNNRPKGTNDPTDFSPEPKSPPSQVNLSWGRSLMLH